MTKFTDRSSKGDVDLTSIVELPNHIPEEFDAWVDKEVATLVGKGCIVRWSEVADISVHPKPKVTLPVGVEPKPRFICNARYLNLMCEHSEFKMDRVGKVAQCSLQGVRVSQRASAPIFMDVFRDVLEGSVLRVDRLVFRMV